ncbi:hypothetical protein MHYP_G00076170 [Metynnis hypsauchen]
MLKELITVCHMLDEAHRVMFCNRNSRNLLCLSRFITYKKKLTYLSNQTYTLPAGLQRTSTHNGQNTLKVPQGLPAGSMSSVNSPACLLARNQFYRTVSPTDKKKCSPSDNLKQPMQSQGNVWVITSSHQGVPGQETGLMINLIVKNPFSSSASSKQLSPAEPVVK